MLKDATLYRTLNCQLVLYLKKTLHYFRSYYFAQYLKRVILHNIKKYQPYIKSLQQYYYEITLGCFKSISNNKVKLLKITLTSKVKIAKSCNLSRKICKSSKQLKFHTICEVYIGQVIKIVQVKLGKPIGYQDQKDYKEIKDHKQKFKASN